MTISEFADRIIVYLRDELDGNPKISRREVIKNNGVERTGITIIYPDENVSPNIYLDDYFYEDITDEEVSDIAKRVKSFYLKCRPNGKVDVSFYLNYNEAKDKIQLKVVNKDMNKDLLEDIPHYDFLDMQVVAYCKVSQDFIGQGTILVRNDHLNRWGIDEERLFSDAFINFLNEEEPQLMSIAELLEMMADDEKLTKEQRMAILEDVIKMREMYSTLPMHVLTNKTKIFGASLILNEDYLYNLSKSFKSDFYILPSSIHELILIPSEFVSSVWELKDMVKTVNETAVVQEELLSDSVYLFSKSDRKVMIAM